MVLIKYSDSDSGSSSDSDADSDSVRQAFSILASQLRILNLFLLTDL